MFSLKGLKAQCNLPDKPLTDFGKDTTAFMMYNFMDRAECYKEFIISRESKNSNNCNRIYMYIYSIK